MAMSSIYTIISGGRLGGTVRRNGNNFLRIQPPKDEGRAWAYRLDYLPWNRLLISIIGPYDAYYYRVDLVREAKLTDDLENVDYLGQERPLVRQMDTAGLGKFILMDTDGSGRFVGYRVYQIRDRDVSEPLIYDFGGDRTVAMSPITFMDIQQMSTRFHVPLGLWPGGYLDRLGRNVVVFYSAGGTIQGYLTIGRDETLLGGTTSHVVTSGPEGIKVYSTSGATATPDDNHLPQGQVISQGTSYKTNIHILPRQIIWQDALGIRAYGSDGSRTLMLPQQAGSVKLVDVQPFPTRDGFLYQVQLPSGQHAAIADGQVIAKRAEHMVVSDPPVLPLFAAILPGPLARYLMRAI